VRARLSSLSANWKALTVLQRDGWNDLASQLPITDALGQTIYVSGFQRYVGTNLIRLNDGLAQIADAPALPAPTAVPVFTLVADTTGVLTVTYTGAVTGELASVFATGQHSVGRNYVSDFRWMVVGTLNSTPAPITAGSAWVAKFGTPLEGNQIAARVDRASEDGLLLSRHVLRTTIIEP
jgi:hypothetical protein